jgi:hypothetical protein
VGKAPNVAGAHIDHHLSVHLSGPVRFAQHGVTRLDIERSAIDRLRVDRRKLQVRAKDENVRQYDDQQQQQFDEPVEFHDGV